MIENKQLERHLKVIALNHLIRKGIIDSSATIINEFTIDNFSRRVDIAIVNHGNLIAIEIKSEADSLDRLEGQTQKYLEYFDKVIVFTSNRHISNVLEMLPKNIEVWVLNGEELKIKRRGKKKSIASKIKYLDLLKKNELESFSKKIGIFYKNKTKNNLKKDIEQSLKNISYKIIKEFTIEKIRNRFNPTSSLFLKTVTEKGSIAIGEISLLSPYATQRTAQSKLMRNPFSVIEKRLMGGNEDPLLAELAMKSDHPIFGTPPELIKNLIND